MVRPTHGGDIFYLEKVYGIKREDIIDFSVNVNSLGAPKFIKDLILEHIDYIESYPDPDCRELRSDISKYSGVSKDKIFVGNGAIEVIENLFEILNLKKIIIPSPTFTEYSKILGDLNTVIKFVELKETENFELNEDDIINAMKGDVDGIVICNPNNPTSTLVGRDKIQKILYHASQKNIYVIVDETFVELTEGGTNNSVVDFVHEFDNLFIVQGITKSMCVPGLRVGYGFGEETLIAKMWRKKLAWSVNGFACRVGKAFFDEDYFARTHEWLKSELNYMYEKISEIPKLKTYKPKTNFMLIQIKDHFLNAPELKYLLATRGILIRDASDFNYLNERFFRVAIKTRENNDRLLKELRDIFK